MERDQSIPVFFMKLEKNDILYTKTDTRFYGHLKPSSLNIYRLKKLNPVCPIYFLTSVLGFATKWTFACIFKNQQWSPNKFEDNKACLITIEASSRLHL